MIYDNAIKVIYHLNVLLVLQMLAGNSENAIPSLAQDVSYINGKRNYSGFRNCVMTLDDILAKKVTAK